ncbi:MAG: methyl-accepting chemotaxis protein [Candidatus Eremiobacteraeota bacterium]|nr:methyl-accepting chemotaxis protein [Candidatus Eremiobacteraeota bacterium]
MALTESPQALGTGEAGLAAAWLHEIAASRDLAAPLPFVASGPLAAALHGFVDGLRAEMLEFRHIVEAAAEVAALNADQLDRIASNTGEQRTEIERAAAAVGEIDQGAAGVAGATESLRRLSATFTSSAAEYDGGIESVLGGLTGLISTVDETASFATAMESGSAQIRTFLEQLRRIARQARLLAINAAIEAAHLGDAGRGFVIVAGEVKQLAESTAESSAEVATIEKQLADASRRVETAIGESAGIVRGLAAELHAARERSAQTSAQVAELDAAIGDVAAIAGRQSTSISEIAHGVETVARHAQDVADAAQRAARLQIADALERLQRAVGRYRLGDRRTSGGERIGVDDLPETLRAAAAALRARVDEDQRELLTLVTAIAVSIARNSYEWKAIASSLTSLRDQLAATIGSVDETAAGATVAAQAAQRMRGPLGAVRAGFASSVGELQRALDRVGRVRDDLRNAASFVAATTSAGERAAEILDMIDTISSETTLLSLNAAIEAAHAGAAGSGFGIIADEIRSLAATTSQATQEIGSVIGGVSAAGRSMSGTTERTVEQTGRIHDDTTRMQSAISALRAQVDHTLDRAAEVASIVEQQLAALADVRRATEIAARRVESDAAAATDGRRIELAMLGMRAHALAARRPLGTVAERLREMCLAMADKMDAVFDDALARGAITLQDCFDTSYAELTGASIAKLARLFDVSKVPPRGFDPPKFETRYDRAVEDGFNRLIDEHVPLHGAIKAMFAVDLNGYCFGHFHECRQDWTGDPVRDLNHNRIKRFFEDDLSLRCSRVGLGDASLPLPRRTAYDRFRELGCSLRREGARPWAIYTYARDTGIVYNDLSVALFARGHRVGTIRIIYDADVV